MNKYNGLLKKNISKYYISQFLLGIEFTAPIFVLFLLANNLSLTQIAILQGFSGNINKFF